MRRPRLRLLLDDLSLVASTTLRGLADNPLQFLVQANRRAKVIPAPRTRGASAWAALRWFMADRPEVAAEILTGADAQRLRPARLAAWLQVHMGLRRATPLDSPRLRAHDALQAGHLTEAAGLAPRRSAMRRRILSDLAVLAPKRPPGGSRGVGRDAAHPKPLFVLTNSLPYTHSGYTTRTHAMLTALRAAGMEAEAVTRLGYPTTVGLPGKPATQRVDGVPYHRLSAPRLPLRTDERLAAQATGIVQLARALHPTVLHTTTDYTNGVATRQAAEELGVPWVYEMRGMLEMTWVASRPDLLREEAARSERVQLMRDKETELAQAADAVIALSRAQKSDLMARGVTGSKITVIPNGIDESLLAVRAIAPAEARASLGLDPEGFWVGSVSSLVEYEGFDVLLEAIARCRAEGLDVRGALVGHGVSSARLQGLVAALGLTDHVVLPGRKEPAEAQRWYQALDAFAVPRRDLEVTRMVTPLKPLAAMALNRPVIASDLPALRELLTGDQGPAGALVQPDSPAAVAEAIAGLTTDENRLRSLVAAGRAVAASRTWQNAARRCHDIYREVQGG